MMTFGTEKRRLLALLAMLAPLPLPFNEVLGWGWLFAYEAGLLLYLLRVGRVAERWLSVTAANVLAIAYLPFLLFDLGVGRQGGSLVAPVLHLGLFAVTVKLFSLRRERDKWHAAFGIFFLFLAAMATSVHLSVALYLVVFVLLALLLFSRFALLHLLGAFGQRGGAALRVPLTAFLVASTLATAVVAVPLFALLPRVQRPYITGYGVGGAGQTSAMTGFSDEVTLDSIGSIRSSRERAMRVEFEGGSPREMRFKGGSYERYQGGSWRKAEGWLEPPRGPVRLAPERAVGEARIWLEPLGAFGLPLPVETVQVDTGRRQVTVDAGGAVRLRRRPEQTLQYTAEVAARPVSVARPPELGGEALDLTGLTPRMATLAREVAGDRPPAEQAERLERYLGENYEYTLDLVGTGGNDPLEDFLFVQRRGHCEYFASALVLLLRSQGIPARLAVGFFGGERTPLGYYIVRQSNAHAWVEAYLPGEGWRIFDPTPPAGRPAAGEQGLLGLAEQLYDTMVFQWDRYVLTYDVDDQVAVVGSLLRGWRDLWDRFRRPEGPDAAEDQGAAGVSAETSPLPASGGREARIVWLLAGLAVLGAGWLFLRLRRPLTATRAYDDLRRRLARAGLPLTPATGPLALERQAARRFPAAAVPAARVVQLYLAESFGGLAVDDPQRHELREALVAARRELRRTG